MATRSKHDEFFEIGMAACNRVIGPGEYYVCPICARGFTRKALDLRILTLEHVPPVSAGGSAICLTCRDCNSAGGYQVDYALAELARLRKMQKALVGVGEFEGPVNVDAGGVSLNAKMSIRDGSFELRLPERHNHPEKFYAQIGLFQEAQKRSDPITHFRVTRRFKLGHRVLSVCVLRAAYLAAFAWFGYRYALHPRLNIVRQQIQDPSTSHVPNSAVNVIPRDQPTTRELLIAELTTPVRGIAVYFPLGALPFGQPVAVLLPWVDGDDDFYQGLSASYSDSEAGRHTSFEATPLGWPNGPLLLLDFAQSNDT